MKKIILTGICAAVVGVLVYFAAITITFIPGVAALYPAAAFESVFGAWFGIWGALASYLGLLTAGTAGGWFAGPNGLVLALSDFIQALAPMIAVRYFRLDPELPNWRHAASYVLVSLLFGSLPGSLIYNYINLQLGVLAGWNSFWVAVIAWNTGNFVLFIVIGIPVLRYGTRIVKRSDLYVSKVY